MSRGIVDYNKLFICCRDDVDTEVNGSCEVKPPQSWCVMKPEKFPFVLFYGTWCTATTNQQGDPTTMSDSDSSMWLLNEVGKLSWMQYMIRHFNCRHIC